MRDQASVLRMEGQTMNHHPFRFGVQMWEAQSAAAWKEKARNAERLGYDILVIPDHFPAPSGGSLGYAPALAAAAAATTRLRIGTNVLDNDFRHPALVASDAATLDLLSDGRFELGIGAGWDQGDYERSGIAFDRPGVRVQRLTESVQIIKRLFTGGPVAFSGEHFTINGLERYPKLVQQPHPPLLIGAAGPRLTAFAAREANIISVMARVVPPGVPIYTDLTAAGVEEKVRWIRQAAGERFDDIELNILMQRVIVTTDWRSAAETLSEQWHITPAETLESPFALIGTSEEMVEAIRARRERHGISYLTVFERDMEAFTPVVPHLTGS